jgi:hypothetical protein
VVSDAKSLANDLLTDIDQLNEYVEESDWDNAIDEIDALEDKIKNLRAAIVKEQEA